MAEVRAFRAIRYAARDASKLIAPPYDVLDARDKEALCARDPHNVVEIDLPHVPPKNAGPAQCYESAAARMRAWLSEGVLTTDAQPAIYCYHQIYTHAGRSYTRKMFFVRLRLEEFGKGQVFPHEQTFGGPKEDRLLLTRATAANLSPIFGLYPDAERQVSAALDAAIHRDPDVVAVADNVENRLWAVTDGAVIENVCRLMTDKPVFIADGHHRYHTALNYRAELAAAGKPLPADHPANFVLCVMAGMEDPGLLILPTHRVLHDMPRITISALREALHDKFDVAAARNGKDGGSLMAQMLAFGPQAMAVYAAGDDSAMLFAPKDPDMLRAHEPARAQAWRRYGLAILHRYVLDEVICREYCDGVMPPIHYIKDTAGAIADAKAHHGLAFIVQSTTMSELRDICTAGELMPQKSTYFFPKLATGMVINPLTP